MGSQFGIWTTKAKRAGSPYALIVIFSGLLFLIAACASPREESVANDRPKSPCATGSLGAVETGLCVGDQCQLPSDVPPEIAAIRHGVYVYQTGFGMISRAVWTAVDFDRRRSVNVERMFGVIVGVPEIGSDSSSAEYMRKSGRLIEIVDTGPLTDAESDELGCAASQLWADNWVFNGRMYDFTIAIGLKDGDASKVIGGGSQLLTGFPASFAKDFLSKFKPPPTIAAKRLEASILGSTKQAWYQQVGDRVFFEPGSYHLSDDGKMALDRWVVFLAGNPEYRVTIEGHADDPGTDAMNLSLGWKRAIAVQAYVVSQGVEPWRLSVVTYGKQRPAVLVGPKGDPEKARAQNRRAVGVLEWSKG